MIGVDIMTKSDLRSGMIVELRDYVEDRDSRFLLIDFNGKLYGLNNISFDDFSDDNYNEDLTINADDDYMSCCDIVKVYKPKHIYSIGATLEDNNLELLWERNKQISKIKELPFEKASYKQMTEKLNELIKVVNEMSDKI